MIHEYRKEHGGIELRPLGHDDIESLRVWRNDAENSRFIRKLSPITPEMQERWFASDCADETTLTFAVCHEGKLVGSAALYEIEGDSAEFGRLMVGEAKGAGIGRKATDAVLSVAFDDLGLKLVRAEVSVNNIAALKIYVRAGFCIIGKSYNDAAQMDEYKIELDVDRYRRLTRDADRN